MSSHTLRGRTANIVRLLLVLLLSAAAGDPLRADEAASVFLKRIAAGGRITGVLYGSLGGGYWFVSRDRYIYRYVEGEELRRVRLESRALSAPLEGADAKIYLACEDGSIVASTPGGVGAWRTELGARAAGNPAAGADGTVYVATEGGERGPFLTALSRSGYARWSAPLPSEPVAGPVVLSAGEAPGGALVIVSCADRRSYAFGTDGIEVWSFVSAGRVVSPVAGDSLLYLPTEAGTVAAVTSSGTMAWEMRLAAPASLSGFDSRSGRLYSADAAGNVVCIDAAAGERRWSVRAGAALSALLPLEASASVALLSEAGELIRLDGDGRFIDRLQVSPSSAAPASDGGGSILLGGSDWIFSILRPLPGSRENPAAPPFPGGPSGGPSAARRPTSDRVYLESVASSLDGKLQLQTVRSIGERLSTGKPERGGGYLVDMLHAFASGGVFSPVKQDGRLINDFPEVRSAALDLLARYGTVESGRLAAKLLRYDWDSTVRLAALRALAALLDTPGGEAIEAVRDRLAEVNRSSARESEAAAAADALFNLAAYHGNLSERDLQLLLAVAYGPFGRETRSRVLDTLRQGGKRRLY